MVKYRIKEKENIKVRGSDIIYKIFRVLRNNSVAKYIFAQMFTVCLYILVDILRLKSFTLVHIIFITLILCFSIMALFKSLENQLYMDMLKKKEDIIRGCVMKDSKDLLKNQRHDYMNLFQIVYGYLQLNKKDKALNQIKWINSMVSSISKVYRISIFSISMLLEEKLKKADNYSIHLEYNVYSKLDETLRTVANQKQIIEKIDDVFDIIIKKAYDQNEENLISIDIHECSDNITFIFKSEILTLLQDNIKDIYPHAFLEYDIVKMKFKYQDPQRLHFSNSIPIKKKKDTFKSIKLKDY